MAYDPRQGAPSWYASGQGGTAKTRDEYQQQNELYNGYLRESGLVNNQGGNVHSVTSTPGGGSFATNSNTGQVSGSVTDFANPVDIVALTQKYAPQLNQPTGGQAATGGLVSWNAPQGQASGGQAATGGLTQWRAPQTGNQTAVSQSGGQAATGGLTQWRAPTSSPITPQNTTRGTQFLPGSTQNNYDQQAQQALSGANIPSEFSPLASESRDLVAQRLRGLGGPDRTQLAQEAFDIFQQQQEPIYQQRIRGVGQKAAALGRIGAGLTTNDLTDVFSQRNQQEDLLRRSLINDAAGQTLQDRLNALQGTISGSNALEGQDYNRQNATAQNALQRAGLLGQFGQNEFGRNQANYQQNAQERAYQDYLARTAVEDRVRQQQLEQQQAQQEWERQFASNQLAAQIAAQQQTAFPTLPSSPTNPYDAGRLGGAIAPSVPQPQPQPQPAQPQPGPNVFDTTPLGYNPTPQPRFPTDLFPPDRTNRFFTGAQ